MRKIFISPYSVGYLSAFQAIGDISFFKTYSPDIQFNTWFYSSLIQTGAKFIEIIDDPSGLLSRSEFIKQHVIGADEQDHKRIHDRTKAIFTKYSSQRAWNKKAKETLFRSESLINDILYSIKRGCDFIYVGDIPDLSPYSTVVSPELYNPLQKLLSSIKTDDVFIPSPISVIPKKEIKKFSTLIDSDIYIEYSESQQKLRGRSIPAVAQRIKLSAEKLIASQPTLLGLYNNITSLLPLAKLIQPSIGELGEAIHESVNRANQSNLKNNLVIYRYKDISLNHFKFQFEISMDRFEGDLRRWILEGLKEAMQKKLTWKEAKSYAKSYLNEMKRRKLEN